MTGDGVDIRVASDIVEFGWHVIGVLREQEAPPFGYSIGLYKTFGHAELILVGLEPKSAMGLVNDLGRMVRAGSVFQPGDRTAELLEGFDCAFVEVSPERYSAFVGRAQSFYGAASFPLLQCVWPDRNHLFPWNPEFDAELISLQPLLGDPPRDHHAR